MHHDIFAALFLLLSLFSAYNAELSLNFLNQRTLQEMRYIETQLESVYLQAFETMYKNFWTVELDKPQLDYYHLILDRFKIMMTCY